LHGLGSNFDEAAQEQLPRLGFFPLDLKFWGSLWLLVIFDLVCHNLGFFLVKWHVLAVLRYHLIQTLTSMTLKTIFILHILHMYFALLTLTAEVSVLIIPRIPSHYSLFGTI